MLAVNALTKRYGNVTVVDQVSFTLQAGSIRAVLGENGAGKSTIMKMLTGVVPSDAGEIVIDGQCVRPTSTREAAQMGISMVHQELQLVPELSLADNLMLVRPPAAAGIRRGSKAEAEYVNAQLKRVGLMLPSTSKANTLSAAQAQLLEIAKALSLDTKILILDEPTSALPPEEVERLLEVIENLRDTGHAILYISHHLAEIMRVADTLTVLRDGQLVGNFEQGNISESELVRLMVDRPVSLYHAALQPATDQLMLSLHDVQANNIRGLNIEIYQGEIIGFAGLIGSGMHDAGQAICGANRLHAGEVRLQDKLCSFKQPYDALQAGVVLLPEERKAQSIVADLSVHDNIHIGRYQRYARWGVLQLALMLEASKAAVARFDIRLHSLQQAIATLSGGNQQKAVLARCIQSLPKVLVLAEPTRGIDIAAKDEIHQLIIDLAAQGMSIVLISSEMEEVIALSHRVAVFAGGEMTAVLAGDEILPASIMAKASPKRE